MFTAFPDCACIDIFQVALSFFLAPLPKTKQCVAAHSGHAQAWLGRDQKMLAADLDPLHAAESLGDGTYHGYGFGYD